MLAAAWWRWRPPIEDLNLRPAVKKAIILLLYRAYIKVLKDALAHLGPYQTLMSASYNNNIIAFLTAGLRFKSSIQ